MRRCARRFKARRNIHGAGSVLLDFVWAAHQHGSEGRDDRKGQQYRGRAEPVRCELEEPANKQRKTDQRFGQRGVAGTESIFDHVSRLQLASGAHALVGDLRREDRRRRAESSAETAEREENAALADNVANDSGDIILDVSGLAAGAAVFDTESVIDAVGTLGDQMGALAGMAVHSETYKLMLKQDLIEFLPDSAGRPIASYRGMALTIDDLMPVTTGVYTTAFFAPGAVGWGMTAPRVADGTEIENKPSAGQGGGQQILHSRANLTIHPAGFAWQEDTVVAESPSIAELVVETNWNRIVERKAVGMAFLRHRLAPAA